MAFFQYYLRYLLLSKGDIFIPLVQLSQMSIQYNSKALLLLYCVTLYIVQMKIVVVHKSIVKVKLIKQVRCDTVDLEVSHAYVALKFLVKSTFSNILPIGLDHY